MKQTNDLSSMQALSALADGEVDARLAASISAAWRDDAALRERWHAYHLIGDVLRSDELAGAEHDAAFLERLRSRLDKEPVVLAPAARAEPPAAVAGASARASGARRRRWAAPAAVAAGFVAVAGVLTVTRMPVSTGGTSVGPQLAQVVPSAGTSALAGLVGPVAVTDNAPDRAESSSMVMIRDARLDQYLTAHKQFGGSSALGVPPGFLRSATFERPSAAPGAR